MNHKLAVATVSLGWHRSHTLERKIEAAKSAGISGVELHDTDLNNFAKSHGMARLEAAAAVGKLCNRSNMEIIAYGPFSNFEGEPTPLEGRLDTAREWMQIAHNLGTDVIQIPANDSKAAIGEERVIITELQALADLGRQQDSPISFAYEALAWSAHVADWEESLRVVQHVDRSNFGLCLDTYHVLARVWADARAPSGLRPGGASALRDSVQRFLDSCPPERIAYVQLSDAERQRSPLLPGHPAYAADQDCTRSWCLYGRLFPYETEKGAYLPMDDILRAWLLDKKWSGWVSMEVFHRNMAEESMVSELWAERARTSWDRVVQVLQKHAQQQTTDMQQ